MQHWRLRQGRSGFTCWFFIAKGLIYRLFKGMKFSILYSNLLALCVAPFVSAGEGSPTPATDNEKVGSALRFLSLIHI